MFVVVVIVFIVVAVVAIIIILNLVILTVIFVVIAIFTVFNDIFIYHQLTSPSTFIFNPSTTIMTSISLYSFC